MIGVPRAFLEMFPTCLHLWSGALSAPRPRADELLAWPNIEAATTNYLTPMMAPGSALYKATDVLDTHAGQIAVKSAQGVLVGAEKASDWVNSIPKP
jgi:hypothetical protein